MKLIVWVVVLVLLAGCGLEKAYRTGPDDTGVRWPDQAEKK